mgnify:CR=1 FL=1
MKKYTILILIAATLFSCGNTSKKNTISIEESHLYVDDALYIIKGICYNPVPKGSAKRNFSTIDQDLTIMVEAGINTIRVYSPIDDIEVLDKIHAAGLKVVIGFGYNQDGKFDILSGTFIDYVRKYKNHNAILLWELGNEYNYHPEWFKDDIKNWYSALNNAAKQIHEIDKELKVTTAHGELPDDLALSLCSEVDVWGLNVYRWDDPDKLYAQWKAVSNKPMYLSEAGGDSYMTITKAGYKEGVNEQAQADANAKILESVFNNQDICSGVTMFAFSDELWKAGNNDVQDIGGYAPNSSGVPYDGSPNEEFWGIVDIDRNKKLTFDVIKNKYKSLEDENR